MQFKSLIALLMLAFGLTACSTVSKLVYRIDVPQGNYLEADKVAQLKVGMNPQQVQYLLGTPVLQDPYSQQTWYYVFLQQQGYQAPEQHTLIVNFDNKGLVSNFDLDKPLPENAQASVNNAIINAPEAESKSWWQFWK